MNIGKIKIICDTIDCIDPLVVCQHSPKLELQLDDVDGEHLMAQLTELFDPEYVLNFYEDSVIKEYLARVEE